MEQKTKKETWNIYVELQQLLHEVYRALFGMPKKDRVVLGDRIMSAATDALTYYNLAYKFMESRDYYKLLFVREYTKLKELLRLASSQHYSKGIMCLGTMLKFDRAYVNNTTSKRAFKSLSDWKGKFLHGLDRQRLLCSLNTYCGIFKKRNNRKELLSFIGSGLKMFRKKLVLNGKKNCFNLKKGRKTWSNSP